MDTEPPALLSKARSVELRRRPYLIDNLHPVRLAELLACSDFDSARLHRIWDLPCELNLQQAVFKRSSLDLDMIFNVELTLEGSRRDPLIQELMIRSRLGFMIGFAARDSQPIC